MTMPKSRVRLPFARPHSRRKHFLEHACLKTVPLLLKVFNRETIGKREKKDANVVFSNELNKQPDVFFCYELRLSFAPSIAVILS